MVERIGPDGNRYSEKKWSAISDSNPYAGKKLDKKPTEIPEDVQFLRDVLKVYDENRSLLLKKHEDYGPDNISKAPGGPLNGLRVRIWDKIARINHLIDNGATPENESLEDSFRDLANYASIAVLVLQKKWPNA